MQKAISRSGAVAEDAGFTSKQDSLPSLDSGEITSQSKRTTFWIFLSGRCGMIEPCERYTAGPKPSACARGGLGSAHWGTPDCPIAGGDDETALLLSMAVAKQLLINRTASPSKCGIAKWVAGRCTLQSYLSSLLLHTQFPVLRLRRLPLWKQCQPVSSATWKRGCVYAASRRPSVPRWHNVYVWPLNFVGLMSLVTRLGVRARCPSAWSLRA